MAVLVVGVDVGQAQLDVAVHTPQGDLQFVGTFANAPAGWQALTRALKPFRQRWPDAMVHVVMEPTGGYEQPLARFAIAQGWRISLPNPKHVRHWARGRGRRAKTDRVDAQVLAAYGAASHLPLWRPLPEEVAYLETLLHRREDLREMLRQERNRRHALEAQGLYAGPVATTLEQHLAFLEETLHALEEEIRHHLAQHPTLKEQADRLLQVPGIGPRNVWFILVLLYRWGTLTHYRGHYKGLTAYVGLDPVPYESGRRVHRRARISREGSRLMRRYLFLGALGGVRGHNPLRAFYRRLVGRGKPKKVALVAAARKLLIWAWAVFRDQSAFDPRRATRGA